MKLEEQEQISKSLSEVINRLSSLKKQQVNLIMRWHKIKEWQRRAYLLFNQTVEIFIEQCNSYKDNIKIDNRRFLQWRFNLDDLWYRLNSLRLYHNRLFYYDYYGVIYNHIFIGEMFECLPQSLKGAKSPFLLVPSGELIVWVINEILTDLAPDWFDENYLSKFDNLEKEEPVISFECHREQNFERQAVLGHEIFHIIVRNNPILEDNFRDLAKLPVVKRILNSDDEDILISQIEELFCDFSASWFYGPIYLQAFTDEISYYPIEISNTHPPSVLRAKFLYQTNKVFKKHRGFISLEDYIKLHGDIKISKQFRSAFSQLGKTFFKSLEGLKLKRYKFEDIKNLIKRSFNVNIPYVVRDVRMLINNLPSIKETKVPQHYSDLVFESLRKTSLLRQVKDHVRESDTLFAFPPAINSDYNK